jgi:uncharacterized SAM-binding protein YcdF (DUF218 family)
MDGVLFVASKLLWGLLRPNTLALALSLVGLALVWRGRRWGRWPLLLGLGWFAAVFALPVSTVLILPLESRFERPASLPGPVTGIVVLGGAVESELTQAHGIPALNGAAERMTETVALARRHPEARVVFTGGSAAVIPGGPSEADTARRLFADLGMPAERLTFEQDSRNTHENAVLTHRLVAPKPGEVWLLVTSASHMPRAMGCFRVAGWQVQPWPVNYTTGRDPGLWWNWPFPSRLNQSEWGLREWIGLVAYRLMGRTDALFPAP